MRKLAFLFVPIFLGITIPLACPGCRPDPATNAERKPPPLDVHWASVVRDHHTALAYSGVRVRVRLDPHEYAPAESNRGWELRVWGGDRAVPPLLLFALDERPPSGPVIVVGTCLPAIRDGIWRTPRHDFSVVIADCVVSGR